PLSFHRTTTAVYENRRNAVEAGYIAHMVRELLRRKTGHSIGIVAFSEAQQDEIDSALEDLAASDPEFSTLLDAEREREENGELLGLFVKNLENVQGDERDVIIVSVCYAPDAQGRMIMNFGPINKNGGERRLNVIFSRAKHHMAVVSTIGWQQITNEYNDGANCLKTYLRYAEAVSRGDAAEAGSALLTYGRGHAESDAGAGSDSVVSAIAAELRTRDYEVDTDVGASSFRCNIAVRRAGEARYRLAILVDSSDFYARPNPDELFRIKPGVLRAFGWNVTAVLAKEWYENRDGVMKRLEGML
ncbi:MAG: hypothetical protein KC492_22125, partial [Myxococcales bacterium]|nr:hypothetical protein [Myxococcales bacterium]